MAEGKANILTFDEVYELLVRLQAEVGLLVMDPKKILAVIKRSDRYGIFLEGCMLINVKVGDGRIEHVEIDAWCVCHG